MALLSTNSTVARVSITGLVFGMAQTVVKPPRAAARVPVAIVSLYSKPGSRRWQCRSMKPGHTTRPAASTILRVLTGDMGVDPGYRPALDQQVGNPVEAPGRIDYAPAAYQDRSCVSHGILSLSSITLT